MGFMCFANFTLDLKTQTIYFKFIKKCAKYALTSKETIFKDYIHRKIKMFLITEATLVSREHFHNSVNSNYGTWKY